jgi:hypothetical protein
MAYRGLEQFQKRMWILIFFIFTIYSLCEWSLMLIFLSQTYQGVCIR